MKELDLITAFIREVETYQSNHYGYYDRKNLINVYNNLPMAIKLFLKPFPRVINKLWRGCDGLSEEGAISFTSNKRYASYFGVYTVPFKELKSYSGIIDTSKVLKLSKKLKIACDVGDDEGEVIVLNVVWNENLNLKKYLL